MSDVPQSEWLERRLAQVDQDREQEASITMTEISDIVIAWDVEETISSTEALRRILEVLAP